MGCTFLDKCVSCDLHVIKYMNLRWLYYLKILNWNMSIWYQFCRRDHVEREKMSLQTWEANWKFMATDYREVQYLLCFPFVVCYCVTGASSIVLYKWHHHHHQFDVMQWQATRKTQNSTSWRPIINRTVVNILLRKNIQNEQKKKKN